MSLRFQCCIEARIDASRVAFVDLVPLVRIDVRSLDIALRVVEIVARLRIDAAHGADHLAGKQDVVHRNHARQQVDARLVIDAGIEEDVVQQMVLEQAASSAPARVRESVPSGTARRRRHAGSRSAASESRGTGPRSGTA